MPVKNHKTSLALRSKAHKKTKADKEVKDDWIEDKQPSVDLKEGNEKKPWQFKENNTQGRLPKSISSAAIRSYRSKIAENLPRYIEELNKIVMLEETSIAHLQLKLQAIRMSLDLVMPTPKEPKEAPKEQGISMDNVKTLSDVFSTSVTILKQVGEGEISSEDADGLFKNLLSHKTIIEIAEIEPMVIELKKVMKGKRG